MRNLGFGGRTCLDSPSRKVDLHKPVGLYPCHKQGGHQVTSAIYYLTYFLLADRYRRTWHLHRLGLQTRRSAQAGGVVALSRPRWQPGNATTITTTTTTTRLWADLLYIINVSFGSYTVALTSLLRVVLDTIPRRNFNAYITCSVIRFKLYVVDKKLPPINKKLWHYFVCQIREITNQITILLNYKNTTVSR